MAKTTTARARLCLSAKPKVEKSDQYFSRAIAKALQALDYVAQGDHPLSLNEIASFLGLTKTSAFRILHTLETLGYISKSSDARYTATKARQQDGQFRILQRMITCGAPFLEQINLEFGETVSMAALMENHIEVVMVLESPQLIRMSNTPGRILQPHASSLGKVISAFQPQEVREHLLRSYGVTPVTAHTIVDEKLLREEFSRIHAQGFAEDREETTTGGRCFGAPILGSSGYAIGAVSMSMPLMRFHGDEHQKKIVEKLQAATRSISEAVQSF